jgi:hypothetical protein
MNAPKRISKVFLFLFLLAQALCAQDPVKVEEKTYQREIAFVIQSLQTLYNLLGDSTMSQKDKDVIIRQSYLKYFRDDKVQIEDDLDPGRNLPLNKDVQAYLQDIMFFFKKIDFRFEIETIQQGINDKDSLFYLVKAKVWIDGINLFGEHEQRAQDRFFELMYSNEDDSYKIVSIYTTKLSVKEDLNNWWNALSKPWRLYFAEAILVDSIRSFSFLMDSVKVDESGKIIDWSTFMDSSQVVLSPGDTFRLNTKWFYSSIITLQELESIHIAPSDSIIELEPLQKFTRLKYLSFAHCGITNLDPLRVCLDLEILDASYSLVEDLSNLYYLNALYELNLTGTPIQSIAGFENFESLEVLHVGKTLLEANPNFEPLARLTHLSLEGLNLAGYQSLSKLENLMELNVQETGFKDFNVLSPLKKLRNLNISETELTALQGVETLNALKVIRFNSTAISSLEPLKDLEYLRLIYCDKSNITKEEVQRFLGVKPNVLIIYESERLQQWWKELNPVLKEIIQVRMDSLSQDPTDEQLHQIIFTDEVNLKNQTELQSLEGFEKLINVHRIDLTGTSIKDLAPLEGLNGLRELILNSTEIMDLSPLQNLRTLEYLDIRKTPVSKIEILSRNKTLQVIDADSSNVKVDEVKSFKETSSAVVCFQSDELWKWHESLPATWKRFISTEMRYSKELDRKTLQQFVDQDTLIIPASTGIENLDPLSMFYRLRVLRLDHLNLSTLSQLESLTELVSLDLTGVPVRDFNLLSRLYNLEELSLNQTPVSDLSFLIQLPSITHLELSATAVVDIKELEYLKDLEELDISFTGIKKIKPLSDLKKLKRLKCKNTPINPKHLEKLQKQIPGLEVVRL